VVLILIAAAADPVEVKLAVKVCVVVRGGKAEELADRASHSQLFQNNLEVRDIAVGRNRGDGALEFAGVKRQAEARLETDEDRLPQARGRKDTLTPPHAHS